MVSKGTDQGGCSHPRKLPRWGPWRGAGCTVTSSWSRAVVVWAQPRRSRSEGWGRWRWEGDGGCLGNPHPHPATKICFPQLPGVKAANFFHAPWPLEWEMKSQPNRRVSRQDKHDVNGSLGWAKSGSTCHSTPSFCCLPLVLQLQTFSLSLPSPYSRVLFALLVQPVITSSLFSRGPCSSHSPQLFLVSLALCLSASRLLEPRWEEGLIRERRKWFCYTICSCGISEGEW